MEFDGTIDKQIEQAQKSLTYRGRFGSDENRDPNNAERQREIEEVNSGLKK
jgi:hypothetical protein